MSRFTIIFSALFILCLVLFLLDLSHGPASISWPELLKAIFKPGSASQNEFIVRELRLPRALTALTAGGAIALSGLLMQTFFRNPLAGPFVLGVSSGASLGVALFIFATGLFSAIISWGHWALICASLIGSMAVLLSISIAARRLRDSHSLLIIGLMFASLSSAVVSVLQFFSPPELIQSYLFWTFGSLSGVQWPQLMVLIPAVFLGLILSLILQKNLNLYMLGERYAQSMGLRVRRNRLLIIVATCLLAASVTAFCGPIAFLGLAVPHFARNLIADADHRKLVPLTFLTGAVLLLFCDICSQVPGTNIILPINALTSLIGAPVVIGIIMKRQKQKL